MSAATVITSAMPNVPVLSGTEGSLAALIRYMAPILGWEIMFDNGPVIVVRPQSYNGGQPLLYRCNDLSTRGGNAPRIAEVRAYESMSDINTGVGMVGPIYIHKSYTANTTANKWAIVGGPYGFYMHTSRACYSADPNLAEMLAYIGFSIPIDSNAVPVCVLMGCADSVSVGAAYASAITVIHSPSTVNSPYCFVHRSIADSVLNKPIAQIFNGGPHPISRCMGDLVASTMLPYTGNLVLGRPYLCDGAAYTYHSLLPGIYYPCHTSSAIEGLNIDLYSSKNLPVGNKVFISIYVATQTTNADYGQGYCIIDIGEFM